MLYNNEVCNGTVNVCKLFSKFFSSVYEPTDNNVSNVCKDSASPLNNDLIISNLSLAKSLERLDIAKGSGPDGVPPFFLKHTAESISCFIYSTVV